MATVKGVINTSLLATSISGVPGTAGGAAFGGYD